MGYHSPVSPLNQNLKYCIKICFITYVHMCAPMCGCVHRSELPIEAQKRVLDPVELELQVFVSHLTRKLGIKLMSSVEAAMCN